MSEEATPKATTQAAPSSEDEESSNKKFDIRDKETEAVSPSDIARELKAQREILEELKKCSDENNFNLSSLSKFKVLNDGEPTEEAIKLREKVIKAGKDGLETGDIEGLLDVTNPTATTKMEQMAKAFEELEVYNPRTDAPKARYNQAKRLRHRDISKGKTSPGEVLIQEQDQEMIQCPKCPDDVGPVNSRQVWREHLDWKCPECGNKIKDSL